MRPLLLAGGFSMRFGADKRCARLPEGGTLLERSVALWRQALGYVFVALRGDDTDLAQRVRALGGEPLLCERSTEGLGATLAQAVSRLPPGPVLVGLADMPFIRPETLQALAQELGAGSQVVAPFFGERRGNPVGFSADYRPLLMQLTGDRGAGALLGTLPLRRLAVEDAGVLVDIDRPGDLKAGQAED